MSSEVRESSFAKVGFPLLRQMRSKSIKTRCELIPTDCELTAGRVSNIIRSLDCQRRMNRVVSLKPMEGHISG